MTKIESVSQESSATAIHSWASVSWQSVWKLAVFCEPFIQSFKAENNFWVQQNIKDEGNVTIIVVLNYVNVLQFSEWVKVDFCICR